MAQTERAKRGLMAKWRDRRRRRTERDLERVARRPSSRDELTFDQTEQTVRAVATSSGGTIG